MLIYQNTPTVADGMPGSIMLRACDDRFPSKTVRSTVGLKEVIEFSAVVCVCLSSRNRRGYQGEIRTVLVILETFGLGRAERDRDATMRCSR